MTLPVTIVEWHDPLESWTYRIVDSGAFLTLERKDMDAMLQTSWQLVRKLQTSGKAPYGDASVLRLLGLAVRAAATGSVMEPRAHDGFKGEF